MKYLLIVLLLGTLGLDIYKTFEDKKTVEMFCSIKYQNDVESYKSCKKLSTKKLILKLKDEENNKRTAIVPLAIIE